MLQIYFYMEITVHFKPWKQIEALDCTPVLLYIGSEADMIALN